MEALGASFGFVLCLVAVLLAQSSAHIWRPTTLPPNPNDPYYAKFQKVPPPKVTADKLIKNFLRIRNVGTISKRQKENEDIIIVMDGSGSIGQCEFRKGKEALKYLMDESDVSSYDTKYAAVTFSTSVSVNFNFLPYAIAAKKIMLVSYPGGSTNTQAGLQNAKQMFRDSSSGRREDSYKTVLLVTDGRSNVNSHLTETRAKALRRSGVLVQVIAIGNYIDGIGEIVKVASGPRENNVFRIKDYNGFFEIVKLIMKKISPGKYAVAKGQFQPPC